MWVNLNRNSTAQNARVKSDPKAFTNYISWIGNFVRIFCVRQETRP